jgi:hypothetical protein
MAVPVERKVQASTAAAAVSGLLLWAAGRYIFKGAVPDVVTSWTYAIVPAAITFAAGYLSRHSPRPAASAAPPPDVTLTRGGYPAGGTTVSELAPPPPGITTPAPAPPPPQAGAGPPA